MDQFGMQEALKTLGLAEINKDAQQVTTGWEAHQI